MANMTLARHLGRYLRPAVLIDTSSLVSAGQRDLGTLSSLHNLAEELASTDTKFPGDGTPFESVIFEGQAVEYLRFFEKSVLGDYDIPKAALHIAEGLQFEKFPEHLRERLRDARELWERTSQKARSEKEKERLARLGLRPTVLSRPDNELLAFALEQADNRRTCYVCSEDEDIIGPVKDLASKNPNIRYVGKSIKQPSILAGDKKPMLISAPALGKLYGMPTQTSGVNYAITTRVPFAGEDVEMIVSVHPADGPIRFVEGDASRHVLMVYDMTEEFNAKGYKQVMLRDRWNKQLDRDGKAMIAKHPQFSDIIVAKSREMGVLSAGRVSMQTRFIDGEVTRTAESVTNYQWLMADDKYLQRFAPATFDYLNDFRRRFPK